MSTSKDATIIAYHRWLQAAGRRPATCKHYTYYLERVAREIGRPAARLRPVDARRWLEDLAATRQVGPSAFRLAHHACKLYFTGVRGMEKVDLGPKPGSERRRAAVTVLHSRQVITLLQAIADRRYRLLVLTLYCTGLRIGECTRLMRDDLLWEQGQIRVRVQKSGGGRLTCLPPALAERLRQHCATWTGTRFVFPSLEDPERPVAVDTVQMVVREARRACGLPDWVTCHTLRHTFATHQLQSGLDVRALAQVMGHASLAPTMRYLHHLDMLDGQPRKATDLCAYLTKVYRDDQRRQVVR